MFIDGIGILGRKLSDLKWFVMGFNPKTIHSYWNFKGISHAMLLDQKKNIGILPAFTFAYISFVYPNKQHKARLQGNHNKLKTSPD